MKREYIAPQAEVIILNGGKIMDPLTDSVGNDDDFCAKEQNNDFFDMDDDSWNSDDMNLWGEE